MHLASDLPYLSKWHTPSSGISNVKAWLNPWILLFFSHTSTNQSLTSCHYFKPTSPDGSFLTLFIIQFSCSVMSDSLQPHGPQHARPPCPSPAPRVYSNSCPLSQWCHPAISSSLIPFSSCPQSFPAPGSFPRSQFFTSGGQSVVVSASVLPINSQDWFPLEWTGWISLQSKGPLRVFSNTPVQKHQFFGIQLSLLLQPSPNHHYLSPGIIH